MSAQNDNILRFPRPSSSADGVRKQIRRVLLVMSVMTLAVSTAALVLTGVNAMLAALSGGLSQIAAAWSYRRVALNGTEIPTPQAMLGRFMLAEVVKLLVALLLLVLGMLAFGAQALWLLGAAMAALSAYWLVLILK